MNKPVILTVNSGSSSLKASLFQPTTRQNFHYGPIGAGDLPDHRAAFNRLLEETAGARPAIVAHRITHGGDIAEAARWLDAAERPRLETLIPLAPAHQPINLMGADLCAERFGVPQVACYDTAFHHGMPLISRRYPIPAGLPFRRYGFHGLSYAHIARQLGSKLGPTANGRIIIAHLGSGASLCLVNHMRSIYTTMGLTPLGGVTMATRSGELDPGVVLALNRLYSDTELRNLLYHQSGLLALSGNLSGDMQTLLASDLPEARFAVSYFCRSISMAIGSMAAIAEGIDALVFTGGIGEHAPQIRDRICHGLGFLGIRLDSRRNQRNTSRLHAEGALPVWRIPADEEAEMARLAGQLASQEGATAKAP